MKLIKGYSTWTDVELLTGVIIGEARGEKDEGLIAVGLTVRTRVNFPRWWGKTWREVILAKSQFSCWGDNNAAVIKKHYGEKTALWKKVTAIASAIMSGETRDTIGKPTHYHTKSILPFWAQDKSMMIRLKQIGSHIFYTDASLIKNK